MEYLADRDRLSRGEATVLDRVNGSLTRINERQELNAFLHVDREGSKQRAAEADERFAAGLPRPLEGMTLAVKDNISVVGQPMTCGSAILEGFRPVYTATSVERLLDAGAIVLGKTNLDEFAMGSSNETSAFGPVLHPIDPLRVPGGSSGGSAVAVAADLCDVALGSETGGSVRQPAAFCGIYGLKPTYGRISRYGLTAFASSLDQIGVFSKTVADMRAVFDVVSGHDPFDSTSVVPPSPRQRTDGPLRIGILPPETLAPCDDSIRRAHDDVVEQFRRSGATIEVVTIPHADIWIPTYFILATAEASSNLARFDGIRYGLRVPEDEAEGDIITASRTAGFGKEVKRRIMLGTYVLSSGSYDAYYRKAQKARRLIADAYTSIYESVDFVVMPTTPTTAFLRGGITDPVTMWLSDYFTVSANIAGIPALSVPVGHDAQGLPIGMQIQGPMFSEELIFDLAERMAAQQ